MDDQNPSPNDTPQVGSDTKQQQPAKDPSLDQYEKIVDLAHKEVEWVHSAYMRYAGILGVILTVSIVIAAGFAWNSYREMRSDLREIKTDLTNQVQEMKTKLQNDVWDMNSYLAKQVADMNDRVTRRIEAEFDANSIKDLVRNTAKERVDQVAREVIDKRIEAEFAKYESRFSVFDTRMAAVQKQIEELVSATEVKTKNLDQILEFTLTVTSAMTNDRKAYDQLMTWMNDKSYPFHERAGQAREAIMDQHESVISKTYRVLWKPRVDASKLSFDALKINFSNTMGTQRIALIQYIWERKDIPQRDKMEFLVQVMRSDADLRVVAEAGRLFSQDPVFSRISQSNYRPLVVNERTAWWDEHKNDPEYQIGFQSKDPNDKSQ